MWREGGRGGERGMREVHAQILLPCACQILCSLCGTCFFIFSPLPLPSFLFSLPSLSPSHHPLHPPHPISSQDNMDEMPAAMLLVGNKVDLHETNEREVSTETGETFAKVGETKELACRLMSMCNHNRLRESVHLLVFNLPYHDGQISLRIFGHLKASLSKGLCNLISVSCPSLSLPCS